MNIPDNLMSFDPMFQPSMDVMIHNYLKYYTEIKCETCKNTWWQKNGTTAKYKQCHKCRTENEHPH